MDRDAYRALIEEEALEGAVLASQLDWKGSLPRRDYPVMLVRGDGSTAGTVGGGIMEHRVIEMAGQVRDTGRAVLHWFELEGEDPTEEDGLCGGTTAILVEPFTADLRGFYRELDMLGPRAEDVVLVVRARPEGADVRVDRYAVRHGETPSTMNGGLREAVARARRTGDPIVLREDEEIVLVRPLEPWPVLHLFGAGHVNREVAVLADRIGLDIAVYDDRADLASEERFPMAAERISDPVPEWERIATIGPRDYVLVATRGHTHDYTLLRWLLGRSTAWLGMVASRRKWKVVKKSLIEEGFPEEAITRVHSPVGLDIGSETVPEIAVSIVAEIVHHARRGTRSPITMSVEGEGA